MIGRLSYLIAYLPFRIPKSIIVVSAILALVSTVSSAKYLRWNTSPEELAARGSQYLSDHKQLIDEFGDLERIFVVVSNQGDGLRSRACVDRLEEELRKIPELSAVHASIGPAEQLHLATRAMPESDLSLLADSSGAFPAILAGEGPGRVLRDARRMLTDLAARAVIMTKHEQEEIGSSALLLLNAIGGAVDGSEANISLSPLLREEKDRQYLRADSGKFLFIRLLPTKEYQSLHIVYKVIDKVRDVITKVEKEFPDVEVGLTGKLVLLSDQMVIGSRDMTLSTALSSILVFVAFVIGLRGLLFPTYAMIALAMGIAWTFGLTTFAVGELTLLSAAFTPMLVGIGIDFGIHLIARYQEERRHSAPEPAMRRALEATSHGNVTGSLTTCAAFYTAMLTNSPGFNQLGFIAGSGVILCMLSMTVVLPAMIILHERMFGSPLVVTPLRSIRMPVPQRFLGPGLVVGCAVATAWWVMLAPRVGFRDNVLELQPPHLPSVKWEEKILADGDSTLFAAIVVDDLSNVPKVVERAQKLSTVGVVHSVLDGVKVPTTRREELRGRIAESPLQPEHENAVAYDSDSLASVSSALLALEPFARVRSPKDAERMARLAKDLRELSNGLRSPDPAVVQKTRTSIETFLSRVRTSLGQVLAGNKMPLRDSLPESIRSLLMSPNGKFLVMVHPRQNIWDFKHLDHFVSDLRTVDPGVTGFPIIHFGTVNDLKASFYLSSLLALGSVVAIVWLDCRSIVQTALAMTPMTVALLWTLGWMGLVGIHFNLVNFIGIPILIGISVDNGIHIVHRFNSERAGIQSMGSTNLAVLLTSFTNMIGFGSLLISEHRGARSLGLIMLVGCILTMAASMTVLPSLLLWIDRVKTYQPMRKRRAA